MKKGLKRIFVAMLCVLTIIALVGCGGNKEKDILEINKEKIAKAQKMSEEELAAAAKEEIGDNVFMFKSQTSNAKYSIEKFSERYGINYDKEFASKSNKDTDTYAALDRVAGGDHYADVLIVQEVKTVLQYMDQEILLNYVPKDIEGLKEEDKYPLAALYINKLFLWNKKNIEDPNFFTNVWQLAGSPEERQANPGRYIAKSSFQSSTQEKINAGFLMSLTSPQGVAKLKDAYQKFYGKAYVDEPGYKNIGYKYLTEYLSNITTWHSSDTTALTETLVQDTENPRTVFYASFTKHKGLSSQLAPKDESFGTKEERAAEGVRLANEILSYDVELEGFNGYLYKMFTVIPKTSKYCYTACLFARYMLTEEAFNAGFEGLYAYYSPIESIPQAPGDLPLSVWKQRNIVEDQAYLKTTDYALKELIDNLNKSSK